MAGDTKRTPGSVVNVQLENEKPPAGSSHAALARSPFISNLPFAVVPPARDGRTPMRGPPVVSTRPS